MTSNRPSRREIVRGFSFLSVGIMGTLSGCPSPGATVLDEENAGGSDTSQPENRDGTNDRSGTPDGGPLTAAPKYDGWFEETDNYGGLTVVVPADTDSIEVRVGAAGNGGARGFAPPAIAVTVGTKVRWQWTGEGGEHTVVSEDGTFDSGSPTSAAGERFEYRFNEAGVYKYACEVHRHEGMKGAVSVYTPETDAEAAFGLVRREL